MDLDYSILRLNSEYEFKHFESTDSDLTEYLLKDSKKALDDLSAVTYIFEGEDKILAYFTVSNDKISSEDVPKSKWRRIKKKFNKNYKNYPAVKIGRLAVHKDIRNQKLGTKMIDFIKLIFIQKNKTGCRFITVDAYSQSLGFYEKCKFIYFADKDKNEDTRQMYFDLKSI